MAEGWCAEQNFAQQIAERTKQYHESLRQRAAHCSPLLQIKVESQARHAVAKGLKKWDSGELNIRIALPQSAEAQLAARFIARHLPCSDSPFGSLVFGIGTTTAALIVTSVQHVLKSFAIPIVDSTVVPASFVCSSQQGDDGISYFVRIIRTIVQRQ